MLKFLSCTSVRILEVSETNISIMFFKILLSINGFLTFFFFVAIAVETKSSVWKWPGFPLLYGVICIFLTKPIHRTKIS